MEIQEEIKRKFNRDFIIIKKIKELAENNGYYVSDIILKKIIEDKKEVY